jgi:hypothetical protein
MSQSSDNAHYVRRVVLPSGRAIEVVYFEPLPLDDAVVPTPGDDVRALHLCPDCQRDLVYPVQWEEVSATHWEVLLRCPNCEWSDLGVFDQATVDRFDEELDLGTELLVRELNRLQRANMEAEADSFAAALAVDAIVPEDF